MRIGVASLAHVHAESYVRILHGRDDVDLVVADPPDLVADEEHHRTRERVTRLGVPLLPAYDVLFDAAPDGVVVCAETARHRELTERAAAAGASVLCEKPLATSRADAEAMLAACERAGVHLMTAYPVRFSSSIVELLALVRDGTIGEVLSCTGANNARIPTGDRRWFADPVLAGGGALMDHVVHLADVLLLLVGSPVREVYAQTNRIFHAAEVATETGGLVVLTFDSGVVASIDSSWSLPDNHPTWGGLNLRVYGTRGELSVDVFGAAVTGLADVPLWYGYGADLDAAMLAEFLAAIRERRRPDPDGRMGLRGLEIVLAAYESARTGQPVAVGG